MTAKEEFVFKHMTPLLLLFYINNFHNLFMQLSSFKLEQMYFTSLWYFKQQPVTHRAACISWSGAACFSCILELELCTSGTIHIMLLSYLMPGVSVAITKIAYDALLLSLCHLLPCFLQASSLVAQMELVSISLMAREFMALEMLQSQGQD